MKNPRYVRLRLKIGRNFPPPRRQPYFAFSRGSGYSVLDARRNLLASAAAPLLQTVIVSAEPSTAQLKSVAGIDREES